MDTMNTLPDGPHAAHWPPGVPATLDLPDETLWAAFERRAVAEPDAAALDFLGRPFTWRELHTGALRLAAALQGMGVNQGDRVLLFMQNSPAYVIGFHAVLRAGAVVVPVNPMNKADELGHYITDADAAVAIASADIAPELLAAADRQAPNPVLRHLVAVDWADVLPPTGEGEVLWPDAWRHWLRAPSPALQADTVALHRWADLLAADAAPSPVAGGPRIIVIFDDMGLDRAVFESVMRLPGPLTLSFLPYGKDPQPMVDAARARGDAVLLHLPMEPAGAADPGPHALKETMSASALLGALEWNLGRIHGYIGVNNHMGSKLTRDEAAMKTILSVINERGLFFVDSLTTGKSMARAAGEGVGARVYARDVFLDPNAGKETVIRQLEQVERIAVETGYAVAICHPHPDTIEVIGPWLTSAPARGFKLDTVASLGALEGAWRVATVDN